MDYPFDAVTNKATQLIILGGDNVPVPASTHIRVLDEVGAFGNVSVEVDGRPRSGPMLRADYDKI